MSDLIHDGLNWFRVPQLVLLIDIRISGYRISNPISGFENMKMIIETNIFIAVKMNEMKYKHSVLLLVYYYKTGV